MRQARDRQRKWLKRKTKVGRFKRGVEYQTAQARRRQARAAADGSARNGVRRGSTGRNVRS